MTVDPAKSPHRHYRGKRPITSARPAAAASLPPIPTNICTAQHQGPAEAEPEGTIYTCPMHPEVRQVGPGSCPICGMALEPEAGGCGRWRRTCRHDAPLVDLDAARAAGRGARYGRAFWPSAFARPHFGVCGARAGDAGGAVGRLAVLRARRPIAGHAQSQHVHADRHGHRRRLWLQHRRGAGARPFSPGISR